MTCKYQVAITYGLCHHVCKLLKAELPIATTQN
jgi:hypothetical protein